MKSIVLLGIIVILLALCYYLTTPSAEKQEVKRNKRKEVQDIIDNLNLTILNLREEAKKGKILAIKELELLEEDLRVAEELKQKYK